MPLLIATQNPHKLTELSRGLRLPAVGAAISPGELPGAMPPVEEDGETFADNATKKAREYCFFSELWTLADDSGLEIEALDGAPGVHSARFAGRHGDDEANNKLVLDLMRRRKNRSARFICLLVLCSPDGACHKIEGICQGDIAKTARGGNGFGYDPLFIPRGRHRTFGEMSPRAKQWLSHRGRAMRTARAAWRNLLRQAIRHDGPLVQNSSFKPAPR